MFLFLSAAPDHPNQLKHILGTVANLYRLNVLADSSKVFARVGEFNNEVWSLTDRSSCIRYLETNKPGCVRITQERIRWAPTTDGSQDNPRLEIRYEDLPKKDESRVTLVVDHCDPEKRVSIIERSSKQENGGGVYKSNDTGVWVVDGAGYQAVSMMWKNKDGHESYTPEPDASSFYPDVDEYESSHALVYGIDYMAMGMSNSEAKRLKDNPSRYKLRFSHQDMQNIVNGTCGISTELSMQIMRKLRENEVS